MSISAPGHEKAHVKAHEKGHEKKQTEMHITIPTGSARGLATCLWKWVGEKKGWHLLEDRSEPGYEPGNGPADPGRFDGQIVRWVCVPAKGPKHD